ncbi:gluconate 2-dehydrogenase subunit 3 family protein [Lapillicoccus sp.]|uniref:gluconate 2-dehydrogenase subunit 3 family protein n=1 Tax=Lapillicoccus sp. TaxID=1909287 RepID=UPI0025DC74D0|nr:gluconate 2-dehydrogenase subunit 3 family protein [Lapillicoccus sp.]
MSTFFDPHQHDTLAAAMARIIPTTDTPGATEAGAIDFLESYLAGIDRIYAKPDGSGFEALTGRRADAWRRRVEILRSTYVEGIVDLDRRSADAYGAAFVDLDAKQQDRVLTAIERPGESTALNTAQSVSGYAPVEPALQQASVEISLSFLALLALHTRQGFYADPIYGGNRDRMGWKAIGFPGPSSLAEVHTGRYTVIEYFADGSHEQEMEVTRERAKA